MLLLHCFRNRDVMETNTLLARPSLSPYQTIASTVPSIVTSTPPDSRRSLNGYYNDASSVVTHGTCNFPYPSSLAPTAPGIPGGHKPPVYSSFTSSTDFFNSPMNCQQINPLNSLAGPRNLPNFPFEMYQPNAPGMPGSFLSDFSTIPRFDMETSPYVVNEPQNPGE